MTLALSGHAIESGIAVGQAHIIQRNELEIHEYRIEPAGIEAEVRRLDKAFAASRKHLESLADQMGNSAGTTAEEIIRTHVMMLSDAAITDLSRERIRSKQCNAEWALQLQLGDLLVEFRQIDDPYIASRADDAVQVVRMVQQFLTAESSTEPLGLIPERLAQTVVVASELTPGELAVLRERGIAGVVTEHGSTYSHTAILARSLGIPTVMGVRRGQTLIKEGEQLVLDGHYGIVFADPEESILKHYLLKQAESERFLQSLEAVRDRPTTSLDGKRIRLMANAERPNDLQRARSDGALGVGLYRSEFLFLQGNPPGEEEQFEAYLSALQALEGGPLVIRTLDIGADKGVDLLDFKNLRSNPNPALGLRAVRLCLRELELFKSQLRAILRTSAFGDVRCLIPMLTSVREVLAVKSLLDETREELAGEGLKYNPGMRLGGMIEVPAAALAIRELSPHLDFLSIGTNDLIQYALATDRVDESVAHLYDPQHPGVIQLLLWIFKAAEEADIPLAVCGEMAGDRRYTRLLLALGLREFSMQPRNLLEVKQVILETDIVRARSALQEWLQSGGNDPESSLVNFLDNSQIDR